MHVPCTVVTLSVLAAAPAIAQVTWTAMPAAGPVARTYHALAYDSRRERTVLFGGLDSVFQDDTWELDGSRWIPRSPSHSPPPRYRHALAYDSVRGYVVLFGGVIGGRVADTWEWDGEEWRQRIPVTSPPAREQHALAYDSVRGRVVLFGGYDGTPRYRSDTWEWDGSVWVERVPAVRPRARIQHAMAFDSARGRVVLFGGYDFDGAFPVLLEDTWEWDGDRWIERRPATHPSARAEHGLAYDSARRRAVLFGGGFAPRSDTWEWDGENWSNRAPARSPAARLRHAIAYDAARGRVVLFGGSGNSLPFADTWVYGPIAPASTTPFGAGCAGSAGTPVLAADLGELPWLGESFTLRLTALPPSRLRVPFLLLGSSRTMAGPHSLPLDLGPFGMAGCSLFVSGEFDFQLANTLGAALWTIAVPSSAALAGAGFFAQAFVLDPGANAAGLAASNAIAGVLGSK